ncbi:MAG: 4Fe-4S binding protein [Candidatus Ranarchaeia archaeon]
MDMQKKTKTKISNDPLYINDNKINTFEELQSQVNNIDEKDFLLLQGRIYLWVKNYLSDSKLAYKIRKLKYKDNFVEKIDQRYKQLQQIESGYETAVNDVSLNLYVKKIKLTHDKDICIGCDIGNIICPKEAIILDKTKVDIDNERCVLCGLCVPLCPVDALSLTVNGEDDDSLYTHKTIPILPEVEKINGEKIKKLFSGTINVDESKCPLTCEECVSACPIGIVEREEKLVNIDKELCVYCGACREACPKDAISIERNQIISENNGYSAVWAQVIEQLIGRPKLNIIHNSKSQKKIISIINDSKLKKYTKPDKAKVT